MARGLCVLQRKRAERPGMLRQHFCEYPREAVNGAVVCSGKWAICWRGTLRCWGRCFWPVPESPGEEPIAVSMWQNPSWYLHPCPANTTPKGIRRGQGRLKHQFFFFFLAKDNNLCPPSSSHSCVPWHPWVVTMLQGGGTSPISWGKLTSFPLNTSGYARRGPHTVLDLVCFADWLPLYS